MNTSVKTLVAAALALGGIAVIRPEPAEAQGYRVFRGGVPVGRVGGFAPRPVFAPRPAFRGGFVGPRYGWGGRPYWGAGYGWGGGYRPYWGPRYYGGYYPNGYYRRGYYGGGAVAAGLIGGFAPRPIAAAASHPYYFGNPHYGAHYSPPYDTPSRCVVERRRFVNRWGRVVTRRIETCY